MSFLAFSLLGFLVSQQLEKYAYENEAQRALLEKMTMIDFLTETYNRRAFFKLAQTMINEAVRNNENLGVIMMDIDHFKKINDTYGHHTGDIVLRDFAYAIKNNIRKSDLFARIGGEEFVILTKTDDIEKLYELANKLLSIIRNLKIQSEGLELNITVSLGAYMFNPKEETLENSLNKADIALYKAKEKRNTLVIFPDLKQKFIG
jgi:diguanylate cyclase (GGDEF)-like protein